MMFALVSRFVMGLVVFAFVSRFVMRFMMRFVMGSFADFVDAGIRGVKAAVTGIGIKWREKEEGDRENEEAKSFHRWFLSIG